MKTTVPGTFLALVSATFLSVLGASIAAAADLKPEQQALFEIYQELVEINTTDSVGDNTAAARAMAARLVAAGFPQEDVRVLVPPGNAKKGNLVARLRGNGNQKPLLLLAHLDVVEAHKEDWSSDLDPFRLIERDGYYYGRGTSDDKAMAAIFVANLIRYRQEGLKPRRDIIVALTADEEGGSFNGVSWLVDEHRALIEAEFGLNEGGGGRERAGKKLFNAVQATEKLYRDFDLEITNKGGHSSVPVRDNAIYRLSAALDRLNKFDFPVNLNEVTRAFFERTAALEGGDLGASMKAVVQSNGADARATATLAQTPVYNSMLRTTCVATMLQAGHARNALPQKATANVNCRILPQESVQDVQQTLTRVFADDQIKVSLRSQAGAPPAPVSPLDPKVMKPIEELTGTKWKGVTVIPIMGTGATDSAYLRAKGIPMYGVSGLFGDIADVRAHGRDERIGIAQFYDGQDFLYRLVKRFSTGK
jgi:acetylornithine deacetylase/succinyl-diaminopimelate desuccinylase-like protein